ncbi:MAG TPA: hypothetical protein VJV78_27840 [Polyangiales bacterium]|nr:hypothetical protein [Polyangiales bacterium]
MSQNRRISRRESLKVCLVPAGLVTANWLLGCSSEASGPGDQLAAGSGTTPAAGNTSMPPMAAGGAGSSMTSAGKGATSGAAGATVTPSAAGSNAAGASGGAGAAGAPQMAAAGTTGSAGMAAAGSGGAGGSMMGVGGSGGMTGSAAMWATGGTKSMMGNYPNPFEMGAGSMCTVYPSQTIGPCYAQMPALRQDISDGLGGLPMRMSFLLVKGSACTPVPNAQIDIWHSGSGGIYSAYATNTTCNPGTMDVKKDMFCRGVQMTDAMGRADFSTVFPGWYKGRTIHIHFTIRVDGRESKTSQLYFEDAMVDEILAQGDYKARGKRDTNNANDTQFKTGGATPAQILFQTAKRADGVLHAWKVITIA